LIRDFKTFWTLAFLRKSTAVQYCTVARRQLAHGPQMEIAQAELELAIRHLKQVEERVSRQREKIAHLRADGLSPEIEEKQLGCLIRSLDVLKTHLADVIDPVRAPNIST
jgi:hypothetical protein